MQELSGESRAYIFSNVYIFLSIRENFDIYTINLVKNHRILEFPKLISLFSFLSYFVLIYVR